MPPKEKKGTPSHISATPDPKANSSATRISNSLARKIVIREASKKGRVDPPPRSDSPPPPPQAGSTVPGEKRKSKQPVPGQGVANYLARVQAEGEAANKAESRLPTSTESPAESTVTTTTPQQENRSSRSSYGEQSVSESTGEGYPNVEVSIRLGTESTRDSKSHRSDTASSRGSLKGVRVKEAPDAEELRKLQRQNSFLMMDSLRDYVDYHSFADPEGIEHKLKSGQIPILEQKLALFHAEHRVTIALNEHQILLEQAQYKPRSKMMSFAEDLLTDAANCLSLDTKGGKSQHAQMHAGPSVPHIIIELAKLYHDINAANAKLLVEAHQFRLLETWIENKEERLKYKTGDIPVEFNEMYIPPRILKEGACHILQNLIDLENSWKQTLRNMKAVAKKAGVDLDQFHDDSMGKMFLKFTPTGHYDFFRMGFTDIRCGSFEGRGDPRFSWDKQTFLKSLALRAMSVHQMRDYIDAFELNCQKALEIAEVDDSS